MTVQPMIKEGAVEAFAETMVAHMTGAAVALATSVGHRSGLFDVMAEMKPATSEEIAAKAQLEERYVREWLASLVTSGVVRYEASSKEYLLPAEHAALLTRKAGADNFGNLARMISGCAKVEDQLLEVFKSGGGVPYEAFEDFQEAMSDLGDPVRERALQQLPSLSPTLVQRLSSGVEVLEIGCGRGYAAIAMAQQYPRSRFVGYDFSEDAIRFASNRASDLGVENVRFEIRDVAKIEEEDQYGVITSFDAIHDQAYPALVLDNLYRALKPGGLYLMMEPAGSSHLEKNQDHPLATIYYMISYFHCMTVSLAQNGTGLGAMWGKELAESMLSDAGFIDIRSLQVEGDFENAYFLSRK